MRQKNNKSILLIIVLLAIIFALNIIDCIQTLYAVENRGMGVEGNPGAKFLFANDLAIISKFIILPILLMILGIIVYFDRKQIWSLYLLLIFFIYVIAHNFVVLIQLGLL